MEFTRDRRVRWFHTSGDTLALRRTDLARTALAAFPAPASGHAGRAADRGNSAV